MVMFLLMVTNVLMFMVSGNVNASVNINGMFNVHVDVSVTDSVNVAVKFTVDVDFNVDDNVYILLNGFDTLC